MSTPLFSVTLEDSTIGKDSFSLSCINIPIQWAWPNIQRSRKNSICVRTTHALNMRKTIYSILLYYICATQPHSIYAIPNTNHALINEPSNDIMRQCAYVNTIIHNIAEQSNQYDNIACMPAMNNDTKPNVTNISSNPYCFIADSDSQTYLLDTGANWFIVNNAKLMERFTYTKGHVKGVSGTSASIQGIGSHQIKLQSQCGHVDNIVVEAVYVPSSLYNIIPPQLLIKTLREQGYHVDAAKHDD